MPGSAAVPGGRTLGDGRWAEPCGAGYAGSRSVGLLRSGQGCLAASEELKVDPLGEESVLWSHRVGEKRVFIWRSRCDGPSEVTPAFPHGRRLWGRCWGAGQLVGCLGQRLACVSPVSLQHCALSVAWQRSREFL